MSNSYVVKLVSALTAQFQPLEDALQVMLSDNVYTATGVSQDVIGDIVGQPRNGLDDLTYRRYLLARIATNRSNGKLEDLIAITALILNETPAGPSPGFIVVFNQGTATVRVFPQTPVDDDVGAILYGFLSQAVSAGVRVIVEWTDLPLSGVFRLDSGPGLDVGYLASGLG